MRKCSLWLAAALAPLLFAQSDFGSAQQFQSGDVVTFIGDSITHGGTYHAVVTQFYATRYPKRQIRFYNCGIGGDRASTIMSDEKFRLNADILSHKPSQATIMLGMNDVGHADYRGVTETPEILKKRQNSLDIYDQNMVKLIEALKKSGAKLTLITPSIYDETTKLEKASTNISQGGNRALGICAAKVTGWAKLQGAGLVKFYETMNAINAREQRKDPSFTVVGPDRVHPGPVGHFVMAYTFLKAQGVRTTVATIAVDAKKRKAGKTENCRVAGVKRAAAGVEFDATESALPMVVAEAARPALDLVPFMKDLNTETLIVSGLKKGRYEVKIDDETVGEFDAAALKQGANLAENAKTPQYKQSAGVTRKMLERTALGERLRNLASQRYGLSRSGVDASDLALVEKRLQDRMEADKKAGRAVDRRVETAITTLRELSDLEKKYDELGDEMIRMAKPVTHHYSLVKK
jgi:lysophospholipase L1-like esterase